jgi:Tol biopolymer transport system component/C-terminal processing protease CtpA/Prc
MSRVFRFGRALAVGLSFLSPSGPSAFGQLPPAHPAPILGARSLALSPDGKQLAFTYRGEIWVASSSGGRATALTNNVEMNDNPVWSPDGQYIAFASNRYGSWDIFVVPAEGGPSKRLTFSSGSEIPSDWTPDGKEIAFVSTRDDTYPAVYTVNVETGRTRKLFRDMMAIGSPHFEAAGTKVVYTRLGFPAVRPRYHGSAASQLWEYDLASNKRTALAKNEFQHLWPALAPGGSGVYTVTVGELTPSSSPMNKSIGKWADSVARTPNVYLVAKGKAKRLTDLVGDAGARFLTSAPAAGLIAYEDLGNVYTLRTGSEGAKPVKLELRVPEDDRLTPDRSVVETAGAVDAALSPANDKVAFVLHNDIWLVPVKKGHGPNKDDATQLTDWAGLDEDPLWLSDGKTVVFLSDRNGNSQVFKLDTESKKATPVSDGATNAFTVRLSPDKKTISYWQAGVDGGLFVVPASGGTPRKLIDQHNPKLRAAMEEEYGWSPDGRYIAYVQTINGSGVFNGPSDYGNVVVLNVASGEATQVTTVSSHCHAPAFSPDGRYLFYTTDQDGSGIYAIPLRAEDAREIDLDLKYEKPKGPVTVTIDFDGIGRRGRRIVTAPAGGPLSIDPTNGEIYFQSGDSVQKVSYSGEGLTTVVGGVATFKPSDDWSRLILVRGGLPTVLELHHPAQPEAIAFRAAYVIDTRREHAAAFAEFWREYNYRFYDPNMHGRDWKTVRSHYEPLLGSVAHRNEMATLLNEMVGELESSHSEVGPAPGNPVPEATAHLGFEIDYAFNGPGLKVASVPPYAPGSFAKTSIKAGEVVTEINGTPVAANEELWKRLNGEVGRDATFTVLADGKTRKVTYRLMSAGEYGQLIYRNRIEARRAYVEKVSGGRLSYVHVPGMSGETLNRYKQEAWQFTRGRQGLIIDVRNNGGGNTSDAMLETLRKTPYAFYRTREGDPFSAPGQTLGVDIAVMCAETSYSNAEMFPAAVKGAKAGVLVGMPTPGYVIWTFGGRLVDGTSIRLPSFGSYRPDGSPLEDNGEVPDYLVDITPEEYFAGHDPQLDKAISVLLKK